MLKATKRELLLPNTAAMTQEYIMLIHYKISIMLSFLLLVVVMTVLFLLG